jgi:hypothetical protein
MEDAVAMTTAGPAPAGPAQPGLAGGARAFLGVGATMARTHAQACDEVRRALVRYAGTGRLALPADQPWTREQLFEHLLAGGRPSERRGYFNQKVQGFQRAITAKVLAHEGHVSPATLLRICVDLAGGSVPLGVLAAQVWTRELAAAGQALDAVSHDVSPEVAAVAAKLEPWRVTSDRDPSGAYDRLGPICHLFSSMTAGVWASERVRQIALSADAILRAPLLSGDHADPEKGHADVCGAALARWITAGMPDSGLQGGATVPFVAPPPKTRLKGHGRWTIEGWDGGGRISHSIDATRGVVTGEIEGWHQEAGSSKTHVQGTVSGRFSGSPLEGRIEGVVTYRADGVAAAEGEGVRSGSEPLTANLIGGKLTGWAITGRVIKSFSFDVD